MNLITSLLIFVSLLIFTVGFPLSQDDKKQPDPNKKCFSVENIHNQKDVYGDPENCHSYYQCFYVNETFARGILRNCQPGTFWHEAVLQCLPENPDKPCTDICNSENPPKRGCYADPGGNCAAYFTCTNTYSQQVCCPPSTSFYPGNCSCIFDPDCITPCTVPPPKNPTTTMSPTVISDTQCVDSFNSTLSLIEDRADGFMVIGESGNFTLNCSAGTEFDLEKCRCDRLSEIVTPSPAPWRQCGLYLPFDDTISDLSSSKFSTFGYGNFSIDTNVSARGAGSLYVNNGRIEIPGMKSHDFQEAGSWCLFFRCPGTGKCENTGGLLSAGQNVTIIASTPGNVIEIKVGLTGKMFTEKQQWNRSTASADGFTHFCVVYGDRFVKIYRNSVLLTSSQADGNVRISHTPYVVGSDNVFGNFTGHIDEVLVCDFAMKPEEITAHLAGQVALINAGLIPSELGAPTTPYSYVTPQPSPRGACGHSKYWNVRETSIHEHLQVVGGLTARQNEFPWQVSINIGCGGSVLNENWVLTAAHCCQAAAERNLALVLYYGSNVKLTSTTIRNVARVFQHPQYDKSTFSHDFCLLQVSEPVKFDTWEIQPVCLPASCGDKNLCGVNETVLISGFGTLASSSRGNTELRKALIPIIPNDVCERRYDLPRGFLKDEMNSFCAAFDGRGGVDTCQGDSGGPLVCYKSGYFTQQGVVSFGEGCAEARYPGVYSNVCQMLDWINSYINKK